MRLLRNTSGNIMIMVVLLSMMAVTFFVFLMGYSLRSIEHVHNLENSAIAYYAAEGAIEKSIVDYFSHDQDARANTINKTEDICTNFTELGEAIVDFFNCPTGDHIGSLESKASRYKKNLIGFLDRYSMTEIWLTENQNEDFKNIDSLKSIKLEWNTFDLATESAPIEIILARWPKDTPKNVQTAHLYLEPQENGGPQTQIIREFLPPDQNISGEATDSFDTDQFNYVLFLQTHDQPTHFKLTGLKNASGDTSQEEQMDLPGKTLIILSKAIIEDKRDSSKTITRALQIEKEIYTDFDSNFSYSRHLIE